MLRIDFAIFYELNRQIREGKRVKSICVRKSVVSSIPPILVFMLKNFSHEGKFHTYHIDIAHNAA